MEITAILDSSAVLAVINEERGGDAVARIVATAAVSTVNLAEVCARLSDQGLPPDAARSALDAISVASVPFDAQQAHLVGVLRALTRRWGLSLGDNACLALARTLGVPALTADRAWAGLDVGVEVSLIR